MLNAHIFSHFAELSKFIILSECHDEDKYELKKYFPDFLWLMRDCDLTTYDEKGEEISTTDYIHKKILVTTNTGNKPPSRRDRVIEAILTMFPKIECQQIPNPGPGISNPAKPIDKDFEIHLNFCIQFILGNIRPKQSFNVPNPLSGQMLASLLEQYVQVINKPDGIPNLEASFQTATEMTLQHKIIELHQAYICEMEKIVEPKLPMEVGNIEVSESWSNGSSS